MIEYACELSEQIITLRCEIALIKVVADDEFFKSDVGEVGRKGAVSAYARYTYRLRRYVVEPVKSRKKFGNLQGCKSESTLAEATDKIAVVAVSDRQTRPTAKAQCLNLVGGIVFDDKLEIVSELRVGKLVPALRHGEVDFEFLIFHTQNYAAPGMAEKT